jgi:membrane-associated phospholipid phosphatase
MADSKIHKYYYDETEHKNLHQMPWGIAGHLRSMTFASAMVLSSLSILGPTHELRETSKVFTVGYWSGIALKNLVKQFHFKPALRPWNEKFSPEFRSYGGFPSGHMFEASYMAMVYGLQFGPLAMVPLAAYTAALFASSIISNRHYTSQAVAGVALGALYGLAAHKVINKSLSEDLSLGLTTTTHGDPAVSISYRF